MKKSCEDYVKGLEEEREKIQVFRRELPLCLQLVNQAIEACKQQMSSSTGCYHGQCENVEQIISSELRPLVGEFFPINSRTTVSEEELSRYPHQQNNNTSIKIDNSTIKKSDWLKSVQLWNQCPDSPSKDKEPINRALVPGSKRVNLSKGHHVLWEYDRRSRTNEHRCENSPKRVSFVEANLDHGTSSCAFHPLKRDDKDNSTPKTTKSLPLVPAADVTNSSEEMGENIGNRKKEEKELKGKTRRSWSGELHRQFLHALQQLGGSHVATPKQIREVMKVDGLTNDEIKSHLQKYRLHERRPTALLNNNNQTQTQTPQFVVVGGIWVPPPEYTVVARTPQSEEASKTANRVYAPVALPPSHHCSTEKRWYRNDIVNSSSPANSSTTPPTTTT